MQASAAFSSSMLFLWTLLALIPCLATSASVGEFSLPRKSEKDSSPAEDPSLMISKYRSLIPSTERHNTHTYGEDIVYSEPSYHYLDEVTGKEESSNSRQAFTARRRNLSQAAFTVKPKSSMQLGPQQDAHDTSKPFGSFRRHRAFSFIPDEQEVELRRRAKRGISSPAVDAVDENPSQWKRFDNTKPQFVTSRNQQTTGTGGYNSGVPQHRSSHASDDNDIQNMKYNEIPVQQREPSRYTSGYGREPVAYRREEEPPRRIIYYANLPEVIRRRPVDDVDYRRERTGYDNRYDYGRSYNKHPRESRYEDNPIRSSGRDSSYSYRQPGAGGSSYAIIDAERSLPQKAWPPPQEYAYRDPDILSKYNRIPAPYQLPQGGGRYPNDQHHGPPPPSLPPPPPPADGPNASLHPSRYNTYGRTGNLPRSQLTVTPSHSSLGDEPYRDYNPRQPAPWSLQIGTKLTVKDDGRQMPSPGGKRFYVQSQQEYPSRYLRSEEDQDNRQMKWQV